MVPLAQPVIKWQKTIGGSAPDYATSIFILKDGSSICGGYSYSDISGEKTAHTRGENDYWLVKLSKPGKIQMDKTIGGNAGDYLEAVQQTSDGGYILGGYSYSNISGEKTGNTRGISGESDYWVVKLNKFGQIEWDKTLGGGKADFLYAIAATSDGGCIAGGYSHSGNSGEKSGANRGVVDYWVVKLDQSGNIQWNKTIGGDKYDYISSLQQTRDGGYIIGGSTESGISGEKTEASRGFFD